MSRGARRSSNELGQTNVKLVLGLGALTVALLLAAVVGAIVVAGDDDDGKSQVQAGAPGTTLPAGSTDTPAGTDTTLTAPEPGAPAPGPVGASPSGGGSKSGGAKSGGSKAGTSGTTKATSPRASGGGSSSGGAASGGGAPAAGGPGDSTGVSEGAIKYALHAPVTFDGAPLNLAEDPIEGFTNYVKFINEKQGGVNGRKIEAKIFDDRYTVPGARTAANDIVDFKPFFIGGTLGVDQIQVIAAEALKRKIPYLAAGGSEALFKDIGMYQVAASYDTHLIKVAQFLGKEIKKAPCPPVGDCAYATASPYAGLKKVGVSELDSKYIDATMSVFKRALEDNGLELVKVVKVKKPTEQTTYATEIQQLRDAGAQIVFPAQDPITTGREVQECVAQRCPWKWTFSNFAHEGDVALDLMGRQWTGYRGLAGACYYRSATAYDTTKCGNMKAAHEQWVAVSTEDEWVKDGQGGASGYQLTHIWLKALKDAGADPTRERFLAALDTYDGYNDLISGPITYKGSPNIAHGAELMVPFEAQVDGKYKQLTPGFVEGF